MFYNLIVLQSNCFTNGSSLPHELGHFFSLLHTHGTNNEHLTTELVDGSNCNTDGDGICDTPADPRLNGLTVNGHCTYTGTETDAKGNLFMPDTSNIMSYSSKSCRTRFTEQQLARMYAFYMMQKSYLSCPPLNTNITTSETSTCESSLTVNFESLGNNITNWEWDVNGDGITDYSTKEVTHTFETGMYDVILTVSNPFKTIQKQYTNLIKVGTPTESLRENFENFNLMDKHGWTTNTAATSDYHWQTNLGNTQTDNTGPKLELNLNSEVNSYVYAEASHANLGDITELNSPCFTVNYQNSELEFSYHMFGKDIGALHVDIKTDSGYINDVIKPLVGQQQNNQTDGFLTKTINLSAYTNETIKIRFRAVRGHGWEGDIAIDDVFINTITTAISNDMFKVYPNPMQGDKLYITNMDFERASTYQICNISGQPFALGTLNSVNNTINLSNLASGLYLLTLTNGKNIVTRKIIK